MDKPRSLSVKDYLVRTLAVKMMVSEKLIDAVVSHQFQEANRALVSNDSIEISGFGKFFFNKKKAIKKMETLLSKQREFERQIENTSLSEQKRSSAKVKLSNVLLDIEYLKPKLYDKLCTDLRGMEEQADSTSQAQGADYENS